MDGTTCTACEPSRFHTIEGCLETATCRRDTVENALQAESCSCGDSNCFMCDVTRDRSTPPVCTRCRNARYLYDGTCLDQCPGSLVANGVRSNFGRECVSSLTCQSQRIIREHPNRGETCACDSDCLRCTRDAANGEVCERCRNSQYLHDGVCVSTCPTNLVAYGYGSYGRECAASFTCVGSRDENGDPCICDQERRCFECTWPAGSTEPVCNRCRRGYLLDGKCVLRCPGGFIPNRTRGSPYDRFCVATT